MFVKNVKVQIPLYDNKANSLEFFSQQVSKKLPADYIPVRFAVTQTNESGHLCEVGYVANPEKSFCNFGSLFNFKKRHWENSNEFNAVMIVPTGIGAETGGHSGDAGPAARLLASVCDNFITHPNVVNASDINELPPNGLYVEGSIISSLLMGTIGLRKVRSNRILLVVDDHEDPQITAFAINAASAARAVLGADCVKVIKMSPPISMCANYSNSGIALGEILNLERLFKVLNAHKNEYDVVAVASVIKMNDSLMKDYFHSNGEIVNPWGGVEALLTHSISSSLDVPSAHAPMVESMDELNYPLGVVDPRMSAEAVSCAFLHCVLKGLHKSPAIVKDPEIIKSSGIISAKDISCVIIPDGCLGLPVLAALEQDIPVIAVKENKNLMKNNLESLPFKPNKYILAEDYLQAVGYMQAIKEGISIQSLKRPLDKTEVLNAIETDTK